MNRLANSQSVQRSSTRTQRPKVSYACPAGAWRYRSVRRRNCQPNTVKASVCTREMSTSKG